MKGATAGLIGLAGCSGTSQDGERTSSSSEQTERETTFRVGTPWNPDSLDPLVKGWMFRKLNVIEPLVIADYNASVKPGLASGWTTSDDNLTWKFTLREGVSFHDGTPLTVDAVVASLRRSFESGSLASLPVESVSGGGERVVEIGTSTPFAPLSAHLTRAPTSIIAESSYDDDGNVTAPVGTGPFQFDSWKPGERITAVSNPSYRGRTPAIDTLVYESVPDDQTRLLKLENAELEMARAFSGSAISALNDRPNVEPVTYAVPRSRYLVYDTTSSPFDDRNVRRAVMHAIDQEQIVESVLNGLGPAAVGPFPPEVTDWANTDLEPYPYDPQTARQLLTDAGWVPGGDAREKDGEPLEIDLWTYDARALPIVSEAVQAQLSQIGFDVSLRVMDYGTIEERANSEAFDLVMWSNSLLWYPDPDRLTDFVHSEDATMFSGYANDRVDELLAEAREITDTAERKRRYDEVQSIVQRDVPIGWLTNVTNVVGVDTGVTGYKPLPTETCYHLENIEFGADGNARATDTANARHRSPDIPLQNGPRSGK
ncbi:MULTISPECIES: ABC transporter substrate-binding protein [unclassified Haloferax]|uniref:ABC transporter substrate-binding protein n=1 Tax=unclassified Haloferax TaxID=2625095 RepID=UPI0002B21B9D|nr:MULTISPECIES: ABC transporter substrate-binding protein [unclassified Haloferax]ELZ59596.1 peptide ABC transporter substrate-binding protein [Haloferax sp. ATCC BAA-646]ELZ60485.1 peptide ABC transporter substrate-binding protein [Haloferax sp. ATCC BAA-645]ELZ72204.1 peptide ABC transporter substrate-binding protein [Haloferax sp. ATCC BAA-644]